MIYYSCDGSHKRYFLFIFFRTHSAPHTRRHFFITSLFLFFVATDHVNSINFSLNLSQFFGRCTFGSSSREDVLYLSFQISNKDTKRSLIIMFLIFWTSFFVNQQLRKVWFSLRVIYPYPRFTISFSPLPSHTSILFLLRMWDRDYSYFFMIHELLFWAPVAGLLQ